MKCFKCGCHGVSKYGDYCSEACAAAVVPPKNDDSGGDRDTVNRLQERVRELERQVKEWEERERVREVRAMQSRVRMSARSKERRTWDSMRRRCYTKTHHCYSRYGARGIIVHPDWDSFERFLADMGPAPSERHTIDRIDNDGNYSKDNCRWADPKLQARNRSVTIKLTARGRTQPMMDWCEELNISRGLVRNRLQRGWDHESALFKPADIRCRPGSNRGK